MTSGQHVIGSNGQDSNIKFYRVLQRYFGPADKSSMV